MASPLQGKRLTAKTKSITTNDLSGALGVRLFEDPHPSSATPLTASLSKVTANPGPQLHPFSPLSSNTILDVNLEQTKSSTTNQNLISSSLKTNVNKNLAVHDTPDITTLLIADSNINSSNGMPIKGKNLFIGSKQSIEASPQLVFGPKLSFKKVVSANPLESQGLIQRTINIDTKSSNVNGIQTSSSIKLNPETKSSVSNQNKITSEILFEPFITNTQSFTPDERSSLTISLQNTTTSSGIPIQNDPTSESTAGSITNSVVNPLESKYKSIANKKLVSANPIEGVGSKLANVSPQSASINQIPKISTSLILSPDVKTTISNDIFGSLSITTSNQIHLSNVSSISSSSELIVKSSIRSSSVLQNQITSSLSTGPIIKNSLVNDIDVRRYGYGIKQTVNGKGRIPIPTAFIEPRPSSATPLTPDVNIKTNVKDTSANAKILSSNTLLTVDPSITKTTSDILFDNATVLVEGEGIKKSILTEHIFDSSSLVMSDVIQTSDVIGLSGILEIQALKQKANIDPRTLAVSFTSPNIYSANDIKINTDLVLKPSVRSALSSDLNNNLTTKFSHIPNITLTNAFDTLSGTRLITDESITTELQSSLTTYTKSIDVVGSKQKANVSDKSGTLLVLHKATATPLTGTLLVVHEATVSPLTASPSNITTQSVFQSSIASPLNMFIREVDANPGTKISNVSDLTPRFPALNANPGTFKSTANPLELNIKSVTTQNIVHGSDGKPVKAKYSAHGLKTSVSASSLTGILEKADISKSSVSQIDDLSISIQVKPQIEPSSGNSLESGIGGDSVLLGSKTLATANLVEGIGANLDLTSFSKIRSSNVTILQGSPSSITTSNVIQPSSSFDVVPNTELLTNGFIQDVQADPLTRVPRGFITTIDADPLSGIIRQEPHLATATGLTPIFDKLFLRLNTVTKSSAKHITPLSFPHTPTVLKTNTLSSPISIDPITEKIIELQKQKAVINPQRAFEKGSVSFSTPTKCSTAIIPGAKSIIKKLRPKTLDAKGPQDANKTTAVVTTFTARRFNTAESEAVKKKGTSSFPVDYITRISTRNINSSTSYSLESESNDKGKVTYSLESNPAKQTYSHPDPKGYPLAPALNFDISVWLSNRSLLNNLKDRLLYSYYDGSGKQSLISTIEQLQSNVNGQKSTINSNYNHSQLTSSRPEIQQTERSRELNNTKEFTVSKTGGKKLDVVPKVNKQSISTTEINKVFGTISTVTSEGLEGIDITAFEQSFSFSILDITTSLVVLLGPVLEEPGNDPIKSNQKGVQKVIPESFDDTYELTVVGSTQKAEISELPETAYKNSAFARTRVAKRLPSQRTSEAKITKCNSYFPTSSSSYQSISEHRESRIFEYKNIENNNLPNMRFTVAIESLSMVSERGIYKYYRTEYTEGKNKLEAAANATDTWEFNNMKRGIYEVYPIAGKRQNIPNEDWPRTKQAYQREVRWGGLGYGFGIDLNIDANEKLGFSIVDPDDVNLDPKYGGILVEVKNNVVKSGGNISGSVSIDNMKNYRRSISNESKKIYSITDGISEETAQCEIQQANITPTTDFSKWWINYQSEKSLSFEPNSVQSTWNSLSVEFDVTREKFTEVINPIRKDAGKITEYVKSGGGFVSTDNSQDGCTVHIGPNSNLLPLRYPDNMLVDNISARPRNNEWSELEVKIELKREEEKTSGQADKFGTLSTGQNWEFKFFDKTITTNQVSAQTKRRSSKGSKVTIVEIRANKLQTKVVEESITKQNRVLIEEWGMDKERKVRDLTKNNRNSLVIQGPEDNDVLNSKEYIVKDWTAKWISQGYHDIKLQLVPKEI